MIDRNLLLNDFDSLAERLATKGVERSELEAARSAVEAERRTLTELEEARAQANRATETVGVMVREGRSDETDREVVRALRQRIDALDREHRELQEAARDRLLRIPNIPSREAPIGTSEANNVVLSTHDFDPDRAHREPTEPHWVIGERLGILDNKRASKLSGSMFSLLRGDGARLLHALVAFGRQIHGETHEEIAPPHLVRTETFTSTGHLPKFANDAYMIDRDELWLIPTGEVPLTSLHAGEILAEEDLPRRYMAYTVCFRREAGSAGKDTRGLQRLHEFHKVELVRLCTPEQAHVEFDALLEDGTRAIRALGLPYRLVDLCTADLTFSSARIIDIEVYAPGTDRWLEVSSVGYFSDFQTRRASVRYRPAEGGRPRLVHALNGSGMATPRVLAALLERGLQPDGSVKLPDVLIPFMRTDRIVPH